MNVQAEHSADASTVEEALAAPNNNAVIDSDSATAVAMQNTLLTPRFYTTDFDEMDAIDVTPVRKDWDTLIAQMAADPNKGHFKKNEDWDTVDWDGMEPALKAEFIDFLISSCTAEFSGCVLYKEMKRRGNNDDITGLFQLMARDEARHAGFINDALREAGRRSATPATSPSSAISKSTPNIASTRSSSGSGSGATTSSAMARRSPC